MPTARRTRDLAASLVIMEKRSLKQPFAMIIGWAVGRRACPSGPAEA